MNFWWLSQEGFRIFWGKFGLFQDFLITFSRLSQDFQETFWGLSEEFLKTLPGLSEDFLRTFWGLSGEIMRTFLQFNKDFLITIWWLSEVFFRSFWELPKEFGWLSGLSQGFCRTFSGLFLMICWGLFEDFLTQPFQRLSEYGAPSMEIGFKKQNVYLKSKRLLVFFVWSKMAKGSLGLPVLVSESIVSGP